MSNLCFEYLSGAKSGLSLVVNIEEYEYMKGPTSDAGVKVIFILYPYLTQNTWTTRK